MDGVDGSARSTILVEGISDRLALEALAERRGRDLAAEGVSVVRTFQKQPAWRGRPTDAQLRRFMHCADRRNTRYPPLLVRALDPDRVPRPLLGVLAHV